MIVNKPHALTTLEVWFPRYSDQYTETKEKVALLACYKVDKATPVLLVNFTKAKHLEGQRYAITREKAMSYPVDSNGKINCYAVPLSAFESWETPAEVQRIAFEATKDMSGIWPVSGINKPKTDSVKH